MDSNENMIEKMLLPWAWPLLLMQKTTTTLKDLEEILKEMETAT